MCGLVALLGGPGQGQAQRVAHGLDAIQHRGPDGRGVRAFAGATACTLGHVRLATMALADGVQPIENDAGTIAVTCSGELYDLGPLRRELEARGHRFRTGSDCELIVHLYAEFGAQGCVERLRGEFAFVLFDELAQTLVAARDGFGVRPLLFSQPGGSGSGTWLFASEAKALFAMGVEARWNDAALSVACAFQYPPKDATLFDGVHQVQPGEVLTIRGGAFVGREQVRRTPAPWIGDFAAGAAELRAALRDAVSQRLRSEVPVAALLSGGLDSTIVAALAAEQAPGLPAYTVCFTGAASYNEHHLAARSAEALGLEHRLVPLGTDELSAALPGAVVHSEGLSINHHIAAKHLLMARLASDGVTVALTGEGADELFFGYAHLRADAGARNLGPSNQASMGLMLPTGAGDAASLAPISSALGFVPTWVRAKAGLGARVRSLMNPEYAAVLDAHQPAERFAASLRSDAGHSHDAPTIAAETWSAHALTGYILETLSDRMELAHAIEGRPAFLDGRVAALARSFPTEFKIRGGEEKAILREAVRGLIPEDVRTREKHPFLAPPAAGYAEHWMAELDRPAFQAGGGFCANAVMKRLRSMATTDGAERSAWQPAILLALSVAWLQDAYIAGGVAAVSAP